MTHFQRETIYISPNCIYVFVCLNSAIRFGFNLKFNYVEFILSDLHFLNRGHKQTKIYEYVLKTLSSFEFFSHIQCSFEWAFESYPWRWFLNKNYLFIPFLHLCRVCLGEVRAKLRYLQPTLQTTQNIQNWTVSLSISSLPIRGTRS